MSYLLQFILAILLADFITGLVHWWEDSYGNPQWKVIGKYIVEPNLVHHLKPRDMAPGGYFKQTYISWIAAVVFIGVPWLAFDWHPFLFVATMLVAAQGNMIHCLAHRTDSENGAIIRAMQRVGIFQSRQHHGIHHTSPYVVNYCIMTNFVNPVLEGIYFWQTIEWMLEKLAGVKVLRGSAVRNGL